jgi:hypothetical protein
MHCGYRGRNILSVDPNESQDWVAVGLDDQQASCPAGLDTAERYLGDGLTRAEVMEYLSQTYGSVFMADLVKHLS